MSAEMDLVSPGHTYLAWEIVQGMQLLCACQVLAFRFYSAEDCKAGPSAARTQCFRPELRATERARKELVIVVL